MPERKRPQGGPKFKWVDNIKIDLGELGCGDIDWIGLAQDRGMLRVLVNVVVNFE
jgi:hypothetical protein